MLSILYIVHGEKKIMKGNSIALQTVFLDQSDCRPDFIMTLSSG